MKARKFYCTWIICFVIFVVIAGIATLARFSGREAEIRNRIEVCEDMEHEDEPEMLPLPAGDIIYAGVVVGVGWILVGIYWLYTTAYAVHLAKEYHRNPYLVGGITFLTNLFGLACLWIDIRLLHSVCPNCKALQRRSANNCSECGAAIYVKCPACEKRISVREAYCTGCGRKQSGEEK